jgi:hypothetical protein
VLISRWDRDTLVGLLIAVAALLMLALDGVLAQGVWPWAALCWLAAVPYLLLPIPSARQWLRTQVIGRPSLTYLVPAGLVLSGVAVTMATGSYRLDQVVVWPLCTAAAVALVTRPGATEPGAGTLLPLGLVVGILAGVWQRTLFIRVPGGTKIGLAFFVALDLALFLLLVARPLASFDVGFGLSGKTVALAVAVVGVVALVVLPIGFAIGFLQWQWRWLGWGYAIVRLFGLILFVGLPEEMLFRGLIQEGLVRASNPRWGWLAASVLFGLAHITKAAPPLNWRYALVATLAGLAYGWVYARTGKLAAAAVTHGGADWVWGTFFHS